MDCSKPVSEQPAGELLGCAWKMMKDAAVAVVSNPGGANLTEWSLAILTLLVLLLLIGSVLRR